MIFPLNSTLIYTFFTYNHFRNLIADSNADGVRLSECLKYNQDATLVFTSGESVPKRQGPEWFATSGPSALSPPAQEE